MGQLSTVMETMAPTKNVDPQRNPRYKIILFPMQTTTSSSSSHKRTSPTNDHSFTTHCTNHLPTALGQNHEYTI